MSFYSQYPDYYDRIFPFRAGVYDFLASHLKTPGGSVLDIGCGVGRYVGRFAEQGSRALGIDLDPEMVAVAGVQNGAGEFRQLDMARLDELGERFDLVFSVGNVVSHVDEEGLGRLARGVLDVMAPAGRWVLQVVNWDYVLGRDSYVFPTRDVGLDGLTFEREYREVSDVAVTFVVRLKRGTKTLFADSVAMHPLRSETIQRVHSAAGFRLVEQWGDFAGKPFDPEVDSGNVMVFERTGKQNGWGNPP